MKHEIDLDYRIKRAGEYPPLAELAEAIEKQDEAAIADWRTRCQAVREKYPKS